MSQPEDFQPTNNPVILLVEDNLHLRTILSAQLEHFHYITGQVTNGKAALAWLSEHRADLVVLDLMLPDMDGLEVCRQIRRHYPSTALPILMLSIRGDHVATRLAGFEAGANDFMAKPYNLAELIARADNLLKMSLKRRNQELEILNEVATAVTSTLELSQILKEVARISCQVLAGTSAYVCDLDPGASTATVMAEYIDPQANEFERIGALGRVYDLETEFPGLRDRMLHPVDPSAITTDDLHLTESMREYMQRYGAKACLLSPLSVEGQSYGYIEVRESRIFRHFTREEIQLLHSIASQVGMAIHNARLHANLRISEGRYHDLFHNVHDLIQSVDANGNLLYVNRCWLETLGYTEEEVIGTSYENFIMPDQHVLCQLVLDRLKRGESSTGIEVVFRSREGQAVYLEGNFSPHLVNGEFIATRTILRDISERKLSEHRRNALNMEREKTRILQRFISDASHDLRTPLTTINVTLHLLKRLVTDEMPQKKLNLVGQEVERLEKLIEDMLKMVRVDEQIHFSGHLSNPNQILHFALNKIEKLSRDKNQTLQAVFSGDLPPIMVNEEYLAIALENLLENAIAYTPDGGTITVRTYQNEERVALEVEDTGIGIDQSDLRHIFERFYRADTARSSSTGGSGLGLSIAQKIVEAHEGEIEVESQPGSGSVFRVWLPIKIAQHTPEAPSETPGAASYQRQLA